MKGQEIRDLLINIKSKGGAKLAKDLENIEGKVNDGINVGLTKTNNKLNTIGRTLKRRIKDFQDLKKLANSANNMSLGGNNLKQSREMSHALKNIAENTNNTNTALNQLSGVMYEVMDGMFQTAALSSDAADGINRIGDEAERTRKNTDGLTKSGTKLGQELKHNNRRGRGQAKQFSSIARAGGALTTVYAALAANLFIVTQAFQALKSSSDLTRLEENISALGGGRNLRGLSVELQQISGYALSVDTSLRTAAQSAAYGFDSETIRDFTKGAKQASIALGIDFNDALTRLTKGVAKMEVELLDELGIVTRLEPAMIKYANAHGKAVKELTDVERKTALAVESMAQLEQAYGRINITSTEYEKTQAAAATVTRLLGKEAAEAFEPILKLVNEGMQPLVDRLNVKATGEGALSALKDARGIVASATAYSEAEKALGQMQDRLAKLSKEYDAASASAKAWAQSADLTTSGKVVGLVIGADEVRRTKEEMDELRASIEAITAEMENISPATEGLRQDGVKNLRAVQKAFGDNFQKISEYSNNARRDTQHYGLELTHVENILRNLSGAYSENHAAALKEEQKLVNAINDAYKLNVASVKEYSELVKAASETSRNSQADLALLDEQNFKLSESSKIRERNNLKLKQAEVYEAAGLTNAANRLKKEVELSNIRAKAVKRSEDIAYFEAQIAHEQALALNTARAQGASQSDLLAIQIAKTKELLELNGELLTTAERKALVQQQEILQQQKTIADTREGTQIQGSAALTSLAGNANLAEVEANKRLGNDEAVWENAAQGIQQVWGELQSLDEAMGKITGGFVNMGQIISQSMQNGSISAEGAASAIGAVSGIMQGISQRAVEDIDHQIAMEKKRDGQSAKSVAKIAELEEKKRKEQQKTALQTAIMQTAAGITQALGSLPPPLSFVMAGITGAMGLAQIAAIKSKGSNASALAAAGGGGPQSIEFGERLNNVDVGQSATAGERAFVTGQAGVGTSANDFIGAASGMNNVPANTAINVGERGAEVFVPEVPGSIVPSGDINSSGSSGSGVSISLKVDAIDSQSFVDRQEDIMDAVDQAIRARFGKSLEDM